MVKSIIALFDYRESFGSKWLAQPYRSGFDKAYLLELFLQHGYQLDFKNFCEIDFSKNWKNQIVLYTSSEEYGYYYKRFIEDTVGGLALAEAINYLCNNPTIAQNMGESGFAIANKSFSPVNIEQFSKLYDSL